MSPDTSGKWIVTSDEGYYWCEDGWYADRAEIMSYRDADHILRTKYGAANATHIPGSN